MAEFTDILRELSIAGSLSAIVRALEIIAKNKRPEDRAHRQDVGLMAFEQSSAPVIPGPAAGSTAVPGFGP